MPSNPRTPLLALSLLLLLAGAVLLFPSPAGRPGPAPQDAPPLLGQVCDRDAPLPGTTVRFKGSPESVTTDSAGRFRLPPGNRRAGRVTAWKDGYLIGGADRAT